MNKHKHVKSEPKFKVDQRVVGFLTLDTDESVKGVISNVTYDDLERGYIYDIKVDKGENDILNDPVIAFREYELSPIIGTDNLTGLELINARGKDGEEGRTMFADRYMREASREAEKVNYDG